MVTQSITLLVMQKVQGLLCIWRGRCLDSTPWECCLLKQLLHQLIQLFCPGWEGLAMLTIAFFIIHGYMSVLIWLVLRISDWRWTWDVRKNYLLYKYWQEGDFSVVYHWMCPMVWSAKTLITYLFGLFCAGFSSWCQALFWNGLRRGLWLSLSRF